MAMAFSIVSLVSYILKVAHEQRKRRIEITLNLGQSLATISKLKIDPDQIRQIEEMLIGQAKTAQDPSADVEKHSQAETELREKSLENIYFLGSSCLASLIALAGNIVAILRSGYHIAGVEGTTLSLVRKIPADATETTWFDLTTFALLAALLFGLAAFLVRAFPILRSHFFGINLGILAIGIGMGVDAVFDN